MTPRHLADTPSRILTVWRRRHRAATRGDAGTSMIELFVAMILMTICGSIFVGAIVTLYKSANEAQAVTASAQQNNQAYQTLDRTVRYAAAISQPAPSTLTGGTGDWYVELRNTADGTERCAQLRMDISTGQLQRRTWQVSTAGVPTTPTNFLPLTSGLTNANASTAVAAGAPDYRPFVLLQPTATARHQVLRFALVAKAGVASQPVSSYSSFNLTALNSTIPVATGSICQQAGRP